MLVVGHLLYFSDDVDLLLRKFIRQVVRYIAHKELQQSPNSDRLQFLLDQRKSATGEQRAFCSSHPTKRPEPTQYSVSPSARDANRVELVILRDSFRYIW